MPEVTVYEFTNPGGGSLEVLENSIVTAIIRAPQGGNGLADGGNTGGVGGYGAIVTCSLIVSAGEFITYDVGERWDGSSVGSTFTPDGTYADGGTGGKGGGSGGAPSQIIITRDSTSYRAAAGGGGGGGGASSGGDGGDGGYGGSSVGGDGAIGSIRANAAAEGAIGNVGGNDGVASGASSYPTRGHSRPDQLFPFNLHGHGGNGRNYNTYTTGGGGGGGGYAGGGGGVDGREIGAGSGGGGGTSFIDDTPFYNTAISAGANEGAGSITLTLEANDGGPTPYITFGFPMGVN